MELDEQPRHAFPVRGHEHGPDATGGGPPMRLLFVLEYFWPQVGGVETLFRLLMIELVRQGHSCTVVTSRLPGTDAEEVHEGIRIVRTGRSHRLSRYAFTIGAVRTAYELAETADLIHTSTYNAAPVGWLAARLRKKPVLVTVHEVLGGLWGALPDTSWVAATAFRTFERVAVSLPFDRYVAVSRATRNALRQHGAPDDKLRTVYNGFDPSDRPAPDPERVREVTDRVNPDRRPMVGYFGRAGVTKGVEVLVEAFESVLAERSARLLLILGDHPAERRARLVAAARERLGDAVVVLRSLPEDELYSHLAACDCLAVPSLTEGFGFTTLEASALPPTVVASDAGAIPEVVSGRHLLVPPGDADALARGLLRALRGDADDVPARAFPISAMIDGYLQTYRELVAPPRGGQRT